MARLVIYESCIRPPARRPSRKGACSILIIAHSRTPHAASLLHTLARPEDTSSTLADGRGTGRAVTEVVHVVGTATNNALREFRPMPMPLTQWRAMLPCSSIAARFVTDVVSYFTGRWTPLGKAETSITRYWGDRKRNGFAGDRHTPALSARLNYAQCPSRQSGLCKTTLSAYLICSHEISGDPRSISSQIFFTFAAVSSF